MTIGNNTNISLAWVGGIGVVLVGVVMWIANVAYTTGTNSKSIDALNAKFEVFSTQLAGFNERTIRIETKLDILLKDKAK